MRRRRLPHGEQKLAPDGSPAYPKVTGSQVAHCFWCYTSAHTRRLIAWLLPVRAGLCLRFRRNTQRVLRLVLPTSGADPLVQDGYMVELLPKLAFFTLWDRPPSDRLAGSGSQDSSVGRLPIGSPPPADPAILAELIGGGSTPPVSRPLHRHMLTWPRTWLPSSWASLILRGLHSFQTLADYRSHCRSHGGDPDIARPDQLHCRCDSQHAPEHPYHC